MLPRNIVQRVIEETDIVDVVSNYVSLTQKGSSMFGLCPFHDDKNPSMSVSRDKKMFNCFSCNTKGNVIYFVSKYENISLDAATLKLADRLGIKVNLKQSAAELKNERLYQAMQEANDFYRFYLHNSKEGQAALQYLHGRGLTDEIIEKFQIGLSADSPDYLHKALNEKNIDLLDQVELGLVREREDGTVYDVFRSRIMFPLTDHDGRIVGFSGRIYQPKDQNAKYINSQETSLFHKSQILYNFHQASIHAKRLDKIFVFEGFMDVIAAEKAGISHAVATMGTALTKDHIKALLTLTKKIVFCFDGDQAGIVATRHAADLFANERVIPQAVCLPEELDPDDYLKKYGSEALGNYLNEKGVSIYEYLFQDAVRDLVLDDLMSVERFKDSMYRIIQKIRSKTIREFLLKKMADTLGVNLSTITADIGKLTVQPPVDSPPPPIVKIKEKETFTRRVKISFDTIIRYAMLSKENYATYLNRIEKLIFPNQVLDYYNLLKLIGAYYHDHERFDEDEFVEKIKENQNLLDTYLKSKDALVSEDMKYFTDCLKEIENYILSFRRRGSVENVKKGNDEIIPDYMSDIRKNKIIKKMEE